MPSTSASPPARGGLFLFSSTSSSVLLFLTVAAIINLLSLLLLPSSPTAHAFVAPAAPLSAQSYHARVLVLPPLHAKGFGFGKKSNPTQEEAEEKLWKGIYSPYPTRRPVEPIEDTPCACGSGKNYATCCFLLHAGQTKASTPEALLRSRYTAYYHGFPKYLLQSTHPSSEPMRPKRAKAYLQLLDIACSEENLKQLQIGEQEKGEEGDDEAFITFRVKRHVWMSERSKFLKGEDGAWLFLDEQV